MAAQNQNSNTPDNALAVVWAVIVLLILFMIFWATGARGPIVKVLFMLRDFELTAILAVVNGINAILHFVHLPLIDSAFLQSWKLYVNMADPSHVDFNHIQGVSLGVGYYIRFLCIAVFSGMIAFLIKRMKHGEYSHVYNMENFRKHEQVLWPQITPVLELNLIKQDIEKGPWAMAQTPIEFGRSRGLLQHTGESWILDKDAAQREFILQMGKLWRGPQQLPIHMQALFVIFYACANKEREVADALLDQIARSAKHNGQLDFSGVEELIKKYANVRLLSWLSARHAYIYGVFATLIEIARHNGVLATAEFLWLKPVDRRLWYMLNSVGRQTAVVEVAGPYAHWLAEKKFAMALKVPMVKEAVNGLQAAIDETLYVDEGAEWQSNVV